MFVCLFVCLSSLDSEHSNPNLFATLIEHSNVKLMVDTIKLACVVVVVVVVVFGELAIYHFRWPARHDERPRGH